MSKALGHRQLHATINALSQSKIVNLDASIKTLLDPIADAMGKAGVGDEVAIHVLCCNEYVLVTGLTQAQELSGVEKLAENIRSVMTEKMR